MKQKLVRSKCEPRTLCALSRGFACGCADGGVLIYQRPEADDAGDFGLAALLTPPNGNGPVRSLHVSDRDKTALILCDELFVTRLSEQVARAAARDFMGPSGRSAPVQSRSGDGDAEEGSAAEEYCGSERNSDVGIDAAAVPYDLLLRAGHQGKIVGLASAVSKSLLVSCGVDRTLRVWNLRRLECQLIAHFSLEPVSVALHPDGIHLAIVFDNRLTLHHVGLESLLSWREVPLPGAKVCSYAHGGHLLAASAGHSIALFESCSMRRVANLLGHLAPVTSLVWSADDAAFTSGGADGMFYSWSTERMSRIHECRLYRGSAIAAVAVLSEPRADLGTGQDGTAPPRSGARRGPAESSAVRPGITDVDENGRKLAEHTVLVVGGDSDPNHPQDRKDSRSENHHNGVNDTGEGSPTARRSKDEKESNPAAYLRLVERTDEQLEIALGSDSLCTVVAMPGVRLAFCGAVTGAIYSVSCATALSDEDRPVGAERLLMRGPPARPHLGAVTALHASSDERLLFSGAADGSLFIFELPATFSQHPSAVVAGTAAPEKIIGGVGPFGLVGGADRAAMLTDVQCISRDSLEKAAQDLADERSKRKELVLSAAQEAARTEAKVAATLAQRSREHSEALEEANKRTKQGAAHHNAELAALHKRFAAFATKNQEDARARQSHLELCLKQEIATHEEVAAELKAVRETASWELAQLSMQVKEAGELRDRLDQEAAAMLGEVKAEYEAELTAFDETAEARQRQLLDEYDSTLLQERSEAAQASETFQVELKSLQMQQYMTRKKLEQHAKEKEERERAIRKKERQLAENVEEMRGLQQTVDRMKLETAKRERELAERDKKILAMHAATQRLESNKQLLELRVKELEEVHEPMLVQVRASR